MKLKLSLIIYASLVFMMAEFQQDERLKESMKRGESLYKTCAACHNKNGEGYAKISPPLAESDYLAKLSLDELVKIVKSGLEGEIEVNGKTYNGKMPAIPFDDQQISDVLNYVRNSFGNKGDYISKEEVVRVKPRQR